MVLKAENTLRAHGQDPLLLEVLTRRTHAGSDQSLDERPGSRNGAAGGASRRPGVARLPVEVSFWNEGVGWKIAR